MNIKNELSYIEIMALQIPNMLKTMKENKDGELYEINENLINARVNDICVKIEELINKDK